MIEVEPAAAQSEVTPRSVVEAARSGDESAWRAIFDLQYPRLYRFFRSRVSAHHQAEDLASSTVLQAFRSSLRHPRPTVKTNQAATTQCQSR